MEKSLDGKVVLVTGAGRGIGKAIALAYADAGADVACVARTLSEIEEVALLIKAQGRRGIAIQADVAQLSAVEEAVAHTVATLGGIDLLIINAGVNLDRATVEGSDPEGWRKTLEVNLFGAYYCAKAAIPHLKASEAGKVILVGSGMGHKGRVSSSAYSCSKAGLWMLTRVLAQELQADNISVNELIPGPVDTSMTSERDQSDPNTVFSIDGEWIKGPTDVVPLALFLATQPAVGPTAQSFSLMRRDN